MTPEYVTLGQIAERTHYKRKYLANNWPRILSGVRPHKFPNCQKLLFSWQEVEHLLLQPK
jgi:hypothetical protein